MGDRKVPRSKDDLKKFRDEIVHQSHVVSEGVIDQVKLVADGVGTVNDQLDRTRKEMKEEIDNKTRPIAHAVLELSGKVNALDSRVISLDGRVIALDSKVDRIHEELRAEVRETRQEVLAAVKFSYAELDKRIPTLEKEFLELKHRIEKIETRSMS